MKLAIITGGSKGLGKALVQQFANNKYKVVEFSRTGATSHNVQCDFKNYGNATNVVNKTLSHLSEEKYSEVVLINNVSTITPIGPISEYQPEKYLENTNVNFLSAIMVSGLFTKYLQTHTCKKTNIFISSGAANRPKHGWSLYCAVKAGLEQFFKTYSLEQLTSKYPIKAIICDPGIIDTGMQEAIRNSSEDLFPEKSRFIGFKNNQELLSPEFVAKEIYSKCLNTSETYIEL